MEFEEMIKGLNSRELFDIIVHVKGDDTYCEKDKAEMLRLLQVEMGNVLKGEDTSCEETLDTLWF